MDGHPLEHKHLLYQIMSKVLAKLYSRVISCCLILTYMLV